MPNSVAGVKDWVFGNPDGQTTVDLRSRIDQLRGSAFLEAYNGLRGGGQITEVEGKKAEDALARLDTAQTDGAAKQALKDFRDAVEQGYAKLAAKAGGKVPALSVPPLEKPVDQMTDQELEAIINGQ
jgi:flagellar protein FlgJ